MARWSASVGFFACVRAWSVSYWQPWKVHPTMTKLYFFLVDFFLRDVT